MLAQIGDIDHGLQRSAHRAAAPTTTSAIVRSISPRRARVRSRRDRPCGNVVLVYSTTPTAGQSVPFTNQGTVRWENLHDAPVALLLRAGDGPVRRTRRTRCRSSASRRRASARAASIVPFRQGPFVTGTDTLLLLDRRQGSGARFPRHDVRAQLRQLPARGARRGRRGRRHGHAAEQPCHAVQCHQGFDDQLHRQGGTLTRSRFPRSTTASPARSSSPTSSRTPRLRSPVWRSTSMASSPVCAPTPPISSTTRSACRACSRRRLATPASTSTRRTPAFPLLGRRAARTSSSRRRSQPQVEVYNTNFYARCLVVPTRDPVIGPIKSAPTGAGNMVLVGATAHGVVIVTVTAAQLAACS